MNYAAIKSCDIANGPGVRVSLFVSGCTHHCPGCFQPETWDFDYGQKYNGKETLFQILHLLEPNYISGLTILGGEPLEPQNLVDVFILTDMARRVFPQKTIWLYTGSTLEELHQRTGSDGVRTKAILDQLDILVDGPFIESKKDISLVFCGSANQRIIDIPKTRAAGKIALWEGSNDYNHIPWLCC